MKRLLFLFTSVCLFLILTITLSLFFVGCESDKPIRIGYLGSLSGRMADIGISARDAVQLAVAQCNERGGIRGRQVELIIKDDQQNVETAVRAMQELIEAKVAAMIGPMTSNMAIVIVPYLNESRVIAVSPTVTTQYLSGREDYFFRICITAREHATRSALHQLQSGDMRRIAVTYDGGNRPFCESWLENFKKPFAAGGGEILTVIDFTMDDKHSFSEIARELLAAEPDGILIIANPMDSALLCQQIRKTNPSIKITLSQWGATQRLIELGGKAVEGVTVPIGFDWDSPKPSYQTFRKIYSDRYRREPGPPGATAYDATQVVLAALNAQKRGQSLKATLHSIGKYKGLQGKIRFDAYGDATPSNASIRIIRNQKFVDLK